MVFQFLKNYKNLSGTGCAGLLCHTARTQQQTHKNKSERNRSKFTNDRCDCTSSTAAELLANVYHTVERCQQQIYSDGRLRVSPLTTVRKSGNCCRYTSTTALVPQQLSSAGQMVATIPTGYNLNKQYKIRCNSGGTLVLWCCQQTKISKIKKKNLEIGTSF